MSYKFRLPRASSSTATTSTAVATEPTRVVFKTPTAVIKPQIKLRPVAPVKVTKATTYCCVCRLCGDIFEAASTDINKCDVCKPQPGISVMTKKIEDEDAFKRADLN